MFKFGTVVLIPFPFTDLTSAKIRPALIISANNTKKNDIMVAFITSKKTKKNLTISSEDLFFKETGLKVTSTVRFDKLATLNKKIILGELGHIPKSFLLENKKTFERNFGFYN